MDLLITIGNNLSTILNFKIEIYFWIQTYHLRKTLLACPPLLYFKIQSSISVLNCNPNDIIPSFES